MSVPMKQDEKKEHATMEERFSTVGARIDTLISKAGETKAQLAHKLKEKRELSEEALNELKEAMDKAWCDVNHAWEEAKTGARKAAEKLHCTHTDAKP